jgi:hypothetical protein
MAFQVGATSVQKAFREAVKLAGVSKKIQYSQPTVSSQWCFFEKAGENRRADDGDDLVSDGI